MKRSVNLEELNLDMILEILSYSSNCQLRNLNLNLETRLDFLAQSVNSTFLRNNLVCFLMLRIQDGNLVDFSERELQNTENQKCVYASHIKILLKLLLVSV